MNQPLAYIHPDARIADNVVIEPFVTISKDVVIGSGTWIGPNVTIMEGGSDWRKLQDFSRGCNFSYTPGFEIRWGTHRSNHRQQYHG